MSPFSPHHRAPFTQIFFFLTSALSLFTRPLLANNSPGLGLTRESAAIKSHLHVTMIKKQLSSTRARGGISPWFFKITQVTPLHPDKTRYLLFFFTFFFSSSKLYGPKTTTAYTKLILSRFFKKTSPSSSPGCHKKKLNSRIPCGTNEKFEFISGVPTHLKLTQLGQAFRQETLGCPDTIGRETRDFLTLTLTRKTPFSFQEKKGKVLFPGKRIHSHTTPRTK